MNALVGFLRLANFVCASTVAFGLAVSLFYPPLRHEGEGEKGRESEEEIQYKFWQVSVKRQ